MNQVRLASTRSGGRHWRLRTPRALQGLRTLYMAEVAVGPGGRLAVVMSDENSVNGLILRRLFVRGV